MYNGYDFFFKTPYGLVAFPITPAELTIKVGSNNKVVTLIDQGDINILKSPALVEVEFEARFPMRKYPYSRTPSELQAYFDIFTKLKTEKKSFRFIVARTTPKGKATWDTNILVALESFEIHESADEGDDVLISFSLKQYKEYGVKILPVPDSAPPSTSTSEEPRQADKATTPDTYTVNDGDTLWAIAKLKYGNGALYTKIYNANEAAIEADAKKHGKASSQKGHWIWKGLVLTIPPK